MTIQKIKHSGAIQISDIIDQHLVTRVYYGYTIKQAKQEFLAEIIQNCKKIM